MFSICLSCLYGLGGLTSSITATTGCHTLFRAAEDPFVSSRKLGFLDESTCVTIWILLYRALDTKDNYLLTYLLTYLLVINRLYDRSIDPLINYF